MQTHSRVRVDRATVDVEVVLSEHLGALIDGTTGSIEDTTKHVLGHADLQALASKLDFGLESFSLAFVLQHVCPSPTFFTSIPEVPSKT